MARTYDFSDTVKNEAFTRQWNRCAHCGESLIDMEDNAHHVVADQAGSISNPHDDFLRTADNCVYLCLTSHYAVHDSGHYQSGATAPPEYYPYSHSGNRAEHQLWADRLNALIARKYGGRASLPLSEFAIRCFFTVFAHRLEGKN